MPNAQEAFEEITQYREKIDQVDKQLVALLNERSGYSLAIRKLKPACGMNLFDPKREDEIYDRVASYNEGPMQDENLKEIYQTLLKVMKEVPTPEE